MSSKFSGNIMTSSTEIAAKFHAGDTVTIMQEESLGHCRTPIYVRGISGRIVEHLGDHPNPEDLAYGGSGTPRSPLYWVEIKMADLWDRYEGKQTDHLVIEVYEHWLEPAA